MHTHIRFPLLFLLLICTVSCASNYAKRSWGPFSGSTGYDEVPVDETTFRVMFDGNPWTDAETVDRFALYRAAELTSQKGYDYFVVMDANQSSDSHLNAGQSVSTTQMNQNVSSYTTHSSVRTIRMFKGEKPTNTVSAYDAKSTLSTMAPYISR